MTASFRVATVLAAVFVSVLPPQLRTWWTFERSSEFKWGAVFSGFLQGSGFLVLYAAGYLSYFSREIATVAAPLMGIESTRAAFTGAGLLTSINYLFQPSSMILLYFSAEGVIRMLSAFVAEEVIGTLPLHLGVWIKGRTDRALYQAHLPPLTADVVEDGKGADYDLRVLACRPKPWDRHTIIGYGEQFYYLKRDGQGPAEHPFVYVLKKTEPWRLVRKPYRYDPNEVLISAGLVKPPAGSPSGSGG